MGNFILVTLMATQPLVSQVITRDQCVAAQKETNAKHCVAVCIDVNKLLISGEVIVSAKGN